VDTVWPVVAAKRRLRPAAERRIVGRAESGVNLGAIFGREEIPMSKAETDLSQHLNTLSATLEVTITLVGRETAKETGTLGVVGKDFLELARTGRTECTIVPFSAIAKIDFKA
jgi:hypothetical protein